MEEEKFYQKIREKYLQKGDDYTELFDAVCFVAKILGINRSLELLEKCVIEKKLVWINNEFKKIERTGDPIEDARKIFYEIYLGITFGKNGKVVERTNHRMVVRCWNNCPVLNACNKFNLDTKIVCRKAYHNWVQILLSQINPRLKFYRNYNNIRPYKSFCEEIIELVK